MQYDFSSQKDAVFPKMVVVAINNICDFKCSHCYHSKYVNIPRYQKHSMDMDVFCKIVDELGRHPNASLRLIAWGEPLLHPKLLDFVRYARQVAPPNPLTLITNGYRLSPDLSLKLMEAGLDLVEVSIDAASPKAYRQIRKSNHGDAFQEVEDNVKKMISLRDQYGFSTRITVSFILYPSMDSKKEFSKFKNKWSNIADEIIRRPAHTFKGSISGTPLPENRVPCRCLWYRCNINPWGEISVCYQDWESMHILGDLRDEEITISDVWQSSLYNRIRIGQRNGIFEGICKTCRDYNPSAWTHPYEKIVDRSMLD